MKSRDKPRLLRNIQYFFQAIPLYFFYGLMACLPVTWASGVGGWIGRTIGPYLGANKRIMRNLTYTWPDESIDRKRAISQGVWDNLGRTIAEAPHLHHLKEKNHISVQGLEHMHAAQAMGKPIIFVGAHLGNWEVAPFATAIHGLPLSVVYRKPNNPFADYLIRRIRKQNTHNLLRKGSEGARGLLRELKAGRSIGVLTDQKMNDGIAIPLLNKNAMTVNIPFILAFKTDAVIIPIQIIRTQSGPYFKAILHPPLQAKEDLSHDEKIKDLATQMNKLFGEWITAYPEQWLWLHRRWGRV